jgi:hypothetical protein
MFFYKELSKAGEIINELTTLYKAIYTTLYNVIQDYTTLYKAIRD